MLRRLLFLSIVLASSLAWGASITQITLGIVQDGTAYGGGWVAPQPNGSAGLNVTESGDSSYSFLNVGGGIPDGDYLLIVGAQYTGFWFTTSGTLTVNIQYSDSTERVQSFLYSGLAAQSGTTPLTSVNVTGGDPTLTLATTGLTTLHLDQNNGFVDGSTDTTLYDTTFLLGTGTASATPEPGTWTGMALGLVGLVGVFARNSKKSRL